MFQRKPNLALAINPNHLRHLFRILRETGPVLLNRNGVVPGPALRLPAQYQHLVSLGRAHFQQLIHHVRPDFTLCDIRSLALVQVLVVHVSLRWQNAVNFDEIPENGKVELFNGIFNPGYSMSNLLYLNTRLLIFDHWSLKTQGANFNFWGNF